MFWDDAELTKRRGARIYMAPPIPDTGWSVPTEFPNLSAASVISFDTETKDTTLHAEGPGWARGKAHIVGISIGAEDRLGNRGAWYFPIRHEVEPGDNMDVNSVLAFADSVLNTPHVPKVGANLTYDIGNLRDEGVRVAGPLEETQFAEALIDSDAFVALDIMANKYVGVGKTTSALYEWLRLAYPHTAEKHRRADIYRAPPRLVGPYAIDDALLPLDVHRAQKPILDREALGTVYRLECDLIPLMIDMRYAGITVDVSRAEQLIEEITADTRELYARVYHQFGFNLQSTANGELGRLFQHVGLPFENTAAGNPSFQKEWLAALEHPLGRLLNDIREHEKIVGTFLRGYILDKSIAVPGSNGLAKLHPQFHQMKGDDNGTVVGRYASSDPNLQNIPARTKLGKKVRTCFVPDHGHNRWVKFDQSQVHYRILAHNAVGPGADELRARYNNDPATDYHWDVQSAVAPLLGWAMDNEELNEFRRRPIKNVNFGLLYGQSEKALAYKVASYFGESFTPEQTKAFFRAYFEGAPYVKPTMKAIGQEVQAYGYVTTLLGRRIRFNLWEPAIRQRGEYYEPLPFERAIRIYGAPLVRAYEYRGVNYKFQGSEPDIIKKGLLDCYKSGVFDYLGVPRATVHDEIDSSIADDSPRTREALDFVAHTMTSCIPMRVPLKVDEEAGPSWGEVKKVAKAA